MKPQSKLFLISLSLALVATPCVLADGPTFVSIDFPGAASTQAWGINPNGDIVGFYVSADKATHAFLKSRGEFTSIDFPGAAFTEANGISPQGDVIGDYAATLNGSGPHHGFVLSSDGVFRTIDYPGATSTFAWGMNSRGDILGTYALDNVNHHFVMSGNQFTTNSQFIPIDDVPGALATVVIAIHGKEITGGYMGADKINHGFVLSDGQITTIDGPSGTTFTAVTGINSRGEMVGRFTLGGVIHGYLLSGGLWNSFDYPGATFTGATSISLRGDIVGRYRDASNVFHGFLLTGFRLACAAGN